MRGDLAARQVHLDFHTGPAIPNVGVDFVPDEFAETLAQAHVDSVTLFARCHHGLCYYPSAIGPRHPGLDRDLLGEQIAACRRRGIRTIAYISVVWDEWAADHHAGWLQMDRNGTVPGRTPLGTTGGWRWLCMGSPYADYVAALTEEVLHAYPLDGVFFDIIMQVSPGCVCSHCLLRMRERGIDPADDAQIGAYSLQMQRAFMARISALVRSMNPDLSIFYNSRLRLDADPAVGNPGELQHFSHVEIESLPSGVWGYNHFPLFARYFQTLDVPLLGMTAAFHKSWADFGTVKNAAALEYECFRMAAGGTAVSVGDQLHPRGRLNAETYRRVGAVFGSLAAKEPWLRGAAPLADIAVLLVPVAGVGRNRGGASEEGALRVLLETHQQFQFVDQDADLSRYALVIAPDAVRLDDAQAARLRAYLAGGGSLLLTGESGLWADRDAHALSEAGVRDDGPGEFCPDYVRLAPGFAPDLAHDMDHIVYERGRALHPLPGTSALAEAVRPYFNRTWEHFSSHAQTPPSDPLGRPAIVQNGRVVVCAHPLFRAYRMHGNLANRQVLAACVERLLPRPLVHTDAPSVAEVTVLAQPERLVVHLLAYVPQRRAPEIDVVEDVLPLRDVHLALRCDAPPRGVFLVPQQEELEVAWADGYASITVPEVRGHQMVGFEQPSHATAG